MGENKRSIHWSERHTSSLKKWNDIIAKTEAGECFDPEKMFLGFRDLAVWAPCGYCDEFVECANCPLVQRLMSLKEENIPICNAFGGHAVSVAFEFVTEMLKPNPDRKIAIKLATIVRNEIAKDTPK